MRDDELANEVKAYLENPIPPQIIWQLLSRDDRRKFCADRQIYIAGGVTELEFKRRTNGGSKAKLEADLKEIFDMFSTRNENKFFREVSTGGNDKALVIYGFERRQHVSAGEIRNEAFPANDKRVSMKRIWEILQTLDGWKLGNRIQNDTAYKDQKKFIGARRSRKKLRPNKIPNLPTNKIPRNRQQTTKTKLPKLILSTPSLLQMICRFERSEARKVGTIGTTLGTIGTTGKSLFLPFLSRSNAVFFNFRNDRNDFPLKKVGDEK